MSPNTSPGPLPRVATYLGRTLAWTAVAVAIVFCLLLLALRLYFFPKIEEFRPNLVAWISKSIGQPVDVEAIGAGWDGWNPRLSLTRLTVRDSRGRALLALPSLDATVAWRWLAVGQLRMKSIRIDAPTLVVRRDSAGRFHVGTVVVDPDAPSEDTSFADWIAKQREVVVQGATFTWIDEMRSAPALELSQVAFRLENGFGRHRFGLTGAPPANLSSPIDVRGDLRGESLGRWTSLTGRLYLQLDYADLAAWKAWIGYPIDVREGRGAMRMWVDFADGRARESIGDFELTRARARFARDLPDVELERLSGRMVWTDSADRRRVRVERLSLTTRQGLALEPTQVTVEWSGPDRQSISRGELKIPMTQLAPLASLAERLPMPAAWRVQIAALRPRGMLEDLTLDWDGEPAAPRRYRIAGRLAGLGWEAGAVLPSVERGSGRFEMTEKGGRASVSARSVQLGMPKVFENPVSLDTLDGEVVWDYHDDAVAAKIVRAEFANAHAAGSISGDYRSNAQGPGSVDLSGRFSRADARQVHRYLPLRLEKPVRDWVRLGLLAGTSSDTSFVLRGNLAEFPFRDGARGHFKVVAKLEGVELDYADHWPKITQGALEATFEGTSLRVHASSGEILGTAIGPVTATIANMAQANPLLVVEGEAAGPTQKFLRVIDVTPVAKWTGSFTSGTTSEGDGQLALKLELPLNSLDTSKVTGSFTLVSNRLQISEDIPQLGRVNGSISFNERETHADNLTAEVFGGPAKIAFASGERGIKVKAQGNADLAQAVRQFPYPYTGYLSGRSDWIIEITPGRQRASWVLDLPLAGATIDLPAPLAKDAEATSPLRIERRAIDEDRDAVTITYGNAGERIGQVKLVRRRGAADAPIERALIALGRATGEPSRPGLWLIGDTPELELDPWIETLRASPATGGAAASGALEVAGIDLRVGRLEFLGREFNDLSVRGSAGQRWLLELKARELAGRAEWQPARGNARARLTARLERLVLRGEDDPDPPATPADHSAIASPAAAENPWPAVDLVSEHTFSRGRDIGRLELQAEPRGADWRIMRLALASPDGALAANGWWRVGSDPRTEVDVTLDVHDARRYLQRHGLPDAVTGAVTQVRGQLVWPGSPQDFDWQGLSGALHIDTRSGQFTRMDPGLGKLLGVLNLQALPRRVALDFRDVFSEGFSFDEMKGDIRITRGMLSTDNLKLAGPAAKVEIAGVADLNSETQKLRVRVIPTLSAGVAVGAAVGLANPAIGAAVLLGQKLLQDPFERIFAYQYSITGRWADPQVERVSGSGSAPREGPTSELRR